MLYYAVGAVGVEEDAVGGGDVVSTPLDRHAGQLFRPVSIQLREIDKSEN